MDPEKKSLTFIFPIKYVIPKSLKFSHWPSKLQVAAKKRFLLCPNTHPKIAGIETSPRPLHIECPHWTQNGPSWADRIAGTHLHPYTVPLAP